MQQLILTHAFGGSADSWGPCVRLLRTNINVITWDLPGHGGRTSEGPEPCTPDGASTQLADMATACTEPPILLGHSLGGLLTLRSVLRHGPPIAGLVLVSTGPGFRSADKMRDWNAAVDRMTARFGMPARRAVLGHLTDTFVIDRLPSIQVPALVVVGSEDRPGYLSGAQFLASNLPHARLRTIAGASHELPRTHPDALCEEIRELVDVAVPTVSPTRSPERPTECVDHHEP